MPRIPVPRQLRTGGRSCQAKCRSPADGRRKTESRRTARKPPATVRRSVAIARVPGGKRRPAPVPSPIAKAADAASKGQLQDFLDMPGKPAGGDGPSGDRPKVGDLGTRVTVRRSAIAWATRGRQQDRRPHQHRGQYQDRGNNAIAPTSGTTTRIGNRTNVGDVNINVGNKVKP